MQSLFRVRAVAPWGGYGRVLVHGMAPMRQSEDEPIVLSRVGPFVPEVTMPFDGLVVTRSGRERIEAAGLTGAVFRPVQLARAVELRWTDWDRSAADPAEYPEGNDPAGYVDRRPHDAAVAEAIGPLFELVPTGTSVLCVEEAERAPTGEHVKNPFTGRVAPRRGRVERRHILVSTGGSDFSKTTVVRDALLSEAARDLLASEWLRFVEIGA